MNFLNWSAEGTTITQEELDKFVESRSRPGTEEIVSYREDGFHGFKPKKGVKNHGTIEHPKYNIIHGLCPCAVCGHKYTIECYKADCQCCSQHCT
jgi:hypothetical protein